VHILILYSEESCYPRGHIVFFCLFLFFFFFQAEDGIRDFHVTGVQTCALPISSEQVRSTTTTSRRCRWRRGTGRRTTTLRSGSRSEERRVGKECRSRWGREH